MKRLLFASGDKTWGDLLLQVRDTLGIPIPTKMVSSSQHDDCQFVYPLVDITDAAAQTRAHPSQQ